MQIIITYIIVALAALFCFRYGYKKFVVKSTGCQSGCGCKVNINKK